MAKVLKEKSAHIPMVKRTSQSKRKASVCTSSMNKSKRRSFKAYRGQGK